MFVCLLENKVFCAHPVRIKVQVAVFCYGLRCGKWANCNQQSWSGQIGPIYATAFGISDAFGESERLANRNGMLCLL